MDEIRTFTDYKLAVAKEWREFTGELKKAWLDLTESVKEFYKEFWR